MAKQQGHVDFCGVNMISRIDQKPLIKGIIDARFTSIGRGVILEDGAEIIAEEVELGDFCYIGKNVRIEVPKFRLGEYSKLHAYSFCYGYKPMSIGDCCWIGGNVTLDSIGGLDICNGVSIGAGSQIWTHIKAGDVVQGCRYNSSAHVVIEEDVWLVGHCLVCPVQIGAGSMAMLGSVVTKDMLPNHTYAGVPAVDVTDKLGSQFDTAFPVETKLFRLDSMVEQFYVRHPEFRGQLQASWFNVVTRTYRKTYSDAEITFMRESVPLAKFYPEDDK